MIAAGGAAAAALVGIPAPRSLRGSQNMPGGLIAVCAWEGAAAAALAGLPALRSLRLDGNALGPAGGAALADALPRLVSGSRTGARWIWRTSGVHRVQIRCKCGANAV